MLTNKSAYRLLSWDRQKQPVIIPDWLLTYAHDWCNAGAKSVYLFGSRSNGFYLPDSDWDIAIVHESEEVQSAIRYTHVRLPIPEEINEIHKTAEDICRQAQKQPNIASEIIRSKLIEGDPLSLPRKKHYPDREELKRHLAETFMTITSTLIGITAQWKVNEKELEDLADTHTESQSAYAAERLVKGLCCIYEQPYEMVHNITEFIPLLPEGYESDIVRMNGTTGNLHVSPYLNPPIESCQDSLNRLNYTLDLFDKMVAQGDAKLTHEELAYIQDQHLVRTMHWWNLSEEEMPPDVAAVKVRLDRTIKGLSNQV